MKKRISPCVKCKQTMSEEWLKRNCDSECVARILFERGIGK